MGGRAVEGTGLENRQARERLVGSNPTPSARQPESPIAQGTYGREKPQTHVNYSINVFRALAECYSLPRLRLCAIKVVVYGFVSVSY